MYEKINKLNITENHLQVLGLFTRGFDKEYYIREVQKILNISPRTAQLILDDLEKKAVLESKMRGKIKAYVLKKGILAKEYLLFTERYKRISFLENNVLIRAIVEKIVPFMKGMIAIFGSYAKGVQKEDSDLDIVVVGSYNVQKVKEISKLFGVEISVKVYSLGIFKKRLRTDILLKEICENHIIIKGIEDLLELWTK